MIRPITEPGVHDAMDDDTYHADPVAPEPSLSASMAGDLTRATPLHCWQNSGRLNPDAEREDKAAFDIGKAFHAYMLGRGARVRVIDAADYRSKDAKAERDAAYEAGETPLLVEQYERTRDMAEAARLQLRASGLGDVTDAGRNEVSMFWRAGGVWNRARPDVLLDDERIVYDIKTSAELADADAWARRSYAYATDLRAAHYLDGLNALLPGKTPWRYRFIVVEKAPPHGLAVVEFSEAAIEIGQRKLAAARNLFRQCLDTGRWPGWPAAIAIVEPPAYEADRWYRREVRDDELSRAAGGRLIDAGIPAVAVERVKSAMGGIL